MNPSSVFFPDRGDFFHGTFHSNLPTNINKHLVHIFGVFTCHYFKRSFPIFVPSNGLFVYIISIEMHFTMFFLLVLIVPIFDTTTSRMCLSAFPRTFYQVLCSRLLKTDWQRAWIARAPVSFTQDTTYIDV